MSLHTQVLLHTPVAAGVAGVLDFVNTELLHAPHAPRTYGPEERYEGELTIGNRRGQGLAAIVWITYAPDGPIAATRLLPDPGPDGDEVHETVDTGAMIVHFDTAYGYAEDGATCNDLHAWFIVALARRFGPVTWVNEYTGQWHRLDDAEHPSAEEVHAFSRFGDPDRVKGPGTFAVAG
jgi:hypothetical protein